MVPRMIVVAGPPGSGKSTAFPVSGFDIDFFNADDRAAELNHGSYRAIPRAVRAEVNRQFENFVAGHIESRISFAIETTLRSGITFDQASRAKEAGFRVEMYFLALESFELHLDRVQLRSDAGGHAAPASVLRAIYLSSLANLPRAIREIERFFAYDNSEWRSSPKLLLAAERGRIELLASGLPVWLRDALSEIG